MAIMLGLRYPSLTIFKISLCPEIVVLPWPLWLRPRVNTKSPMEIVSKPTDRKSWVWI